MDGIPKLDFLLSFIYKKRIYILHVKIESKSNSQWLEDISFLHPFPLVFSNPIKFEVQSIIPIWQNKLPILNSSLDMNMKLLSISNIYLHYFSLFFKIRAYHHHILKEFVPFLFMCILYNSPLYIICLTMMLRPTF
jgi:hypothetical protein